jgi:anthranilate phosphoribosyltransferase
VRTVFNLLGPLTNPARPEVQVVGVPRAELTDFLAGCLRRLGVRRAWVVHGSGLDEVSLCGPTRVVALEGGRMRRFEIHPEDAGLAPCELAPFAEAILPPMPRSPTASWRASRGRAATSSS